MVSFFNSAKLPHSKLNHAQLKITRFGEDSVEKMTDWTAEYISQSDSPTILEIGSGNGTLLFSLVDAGYEATRLAGVDYSPDAVKLARMVAGSREGCEPISFSACDFLTEVPSKLFGQGEEGWDLLLDKGTYDAIALGERDESGRSPVEGYPIRAANLLKKGGHILITCKCAWFLMFVSILTHWPWKHVTLQKQS